ncbi:hypothetical protein OAX78_02950 [Planctomycetota bacterium]|nr:hypothetical protein [Planctomycetota bacterium]
MIRHTLLALVCALTLSGTGCVAALDAGFRELDDHGSSPRYESQSYGAHFVDALNDDYDRDRRRDRCDSTTVVVVR